MPKIQLKSDFRFYRQGCWPEDYKAGLVEVDEEVCSEAKAAGLVEDEDKIPAVKKKPKE